MSERMSELVSERRGLDMRACTCVRVKSGAALEVRNGFRRCVNVYALVRFACAGVRVRGNATDCGVMGGV